MIQPALPFTQEVDFSAENFAISGSNQEAYSWVNQWPEWPSHCLVVHGSAGSGKTHLTHIWQERSQAHRFTEGEPLLYQSGVKHYIVELDRQPVDETAMFHLFNRVKEEQGSLLVTALTPLTRDNITLPDLGSRLAASPQIAILPPDDALLEQVLFKHFSDRQLRVNKEVLGFLLPRMERSFTAAKELVEKIDIHALEHRRNITIPFVREVLEVGSESGK